MKIKTIIILAILFFTSCQLLKKDKLTVKKFNQKEEFQMIEQRNIVSQRSQLILIDSNRQDYTTVLWPKGHFKFTVTNGFEGEAEKILISGRHQRNKMLIHKHEAKLDSTLLKSSYTNERENSVTTKINKASVRNTWLWLLILPFIYLCYWLYKKV